MLFSGLSLADIIARIIALLIAITVHEAAHAWSAFRLGDPTARAMGRLSLNPLRHLDPLGSLMLLVAGVGWGKPVPVNPRNFRTGAKAGMAITSFAGPLSNLVVAGLVALPIRLTHIPLRMGGSALIPGAGDILLSIILLNIGLAIFNLIPIAPLDGFSVAMGLLPYRWAVQFARLEPYGPIILVGLFAAGWFLPIDPLGMLMRPAYSLFLRLFLGV
ncbi:MAG: site-2 protease family protein [Anaerolineae bacterium]